MSMERRAAIGMEVRVDGQGPDMRIKGYAAKFNQRSQDLGGFVEVIAPGAFSAALADGQDVRGLYNHDSNIVLGRTKAKTMDLSEDETGLFYTITPPNTQAARDLMVSIGRGDVDGSSFGFSVLEDRWDLMGDVVVRTLLKVRTLYDVGPVTYPAYLSATSGVDVARRSLDEWRKQAQTNGKGMGLKLAKAKIQLSGY